MPLTLGESINISRVTLQLTKTWTTTPYIHSWSGTQVFWSPPSISQSESTLWPVFYNDTGSLLKRRMLTAHSRITFRAVPFVGQIFLWLDKIVGFYVIPAIICTSMLLCKPQLGVCLCAVCGSTIYANIFNSQVICTKHLINFTAFYFHYLWLRIFTNSFAF